MAENRNLGDQSGQNEKTVDEIKITSLDDFLTKTRRLLQLEKEEEYEQNRLLIESRNLDELCHAGVALKKLRFLDRRSGMGGRRLLKFGYQNHESTSDIEGGVSLPNHKLSPGDTVNLCASNDYRTALSSGVVSKVGEYSITLAFDGEKFRNNDDNQQEDEGNLSNLSFSNKTFTIVQSVNDVTFRRLSSNLESLKDYKNYPGWLLVEYFFGICRLPAIDREKSINESIDQEKSIIEAIDQEKSTIESIDQEKSIVDQSDQIKSIIDSRRFFNKNLNLPQQRAVDFCLNDHHPISIVHGPPGTGKTTVVVEIIRQLIKNGKKVLACAPSNVAVDNLLEKLLASDIDQRNCSFEAIRLGHPARTHTNLHEYSLDFISKRSENAAILDDIRRDIDLLEKEKNRRYANSQRKLLKRELFQRERDTIQRILRNANVVCSTLTSVTKDGPLGHLLKIDRGGDDDRLSIFDSHGNRFDVAVIDECGQATELACWSSLLQVGGGKCILAGDHRQLPPTILSESAARDGFDRSLMARASEELDCGNGDGLVRMLTVQYRMNESIMKWASDNVYDGKLRADESVKEHLLRDIPSVESIEETESALWLIDTSDCDLTEIVTVDDESKANIGEVRLVYLHVDRLIRSGVPQQSIAVVSPYNLQVQLLRNYVGGVYPLVSVRSVDGFQGQEREAVVLSMVRSNSKREIGFLSDYRRINVAVTRARRHLAVVCDGNTLKSDAFLRSLVDYMNENGVTKSALEYEDDYHLIPFSIDVDGLALTTSKPSTVSKNEKTTKKENAPRKEKGTKNKKSKPVVEDEKSQQPREWRPIKTDDSAAIDWRTELKNELTTFASDDGSKRLEFPVDLAPYQRAYIHEVAEHLGLTHFSENRNEQRQIIVEKKSIVEKSTFDGQDIAEKSIESISDTRSIDRKSSDQEELTSKETLSGKDAAGSGKSTKSKTIDQEKSIDISKATDNEKSINARAINRSVELDEGTSRQPVESITNQKSIDKSKSIKNPKSSAQACSLDDDQIMDQFAKSATRCQSIDCRQSIALLREKCRYCTQIFCIKHAMAEAHGCGEAAKRHARMEYERSMQSQTTTKINPEKRERLQTKLDSKLKSMRGDRQQKKSK